MTRPPRPRLGALPALVLALASGSQTFAQGPSPSAPLREAMASISPERLRADLGHLASDAMKGRATPSPELDRAAAWLREQLKAAGLKPAFGDSWYQQARRPALKESRNVGGLLPGSDPARKDELILFTAHYDHIGVSRRRLPDRINNGADDNGTGTCAVLALARALASLEVPPKRPVLFLLFYGEERGLLGSKRYVDEPPFPLRNHRAVFNLEMLGRPDDIPEKSAWVTGWRTSDFGDLIAAAGTPAGVTFYEHPRRSRMLFTRSDNIVFAKRGIPAHSISAGSLHRDYHQPSDEVAKIDFDNMAAVTRGLFLAGHTMADGGPLPTWAPDTSYAKKHAELMQPAPGPERKER